MAGVVLMLRAVNVGSRRVAMPALRELLSGAGYDDVRTYLQSGNVVLSSRSDPERLAADVRGLISEHFGFDIPVIVRTRAELEAVLAHNPFPEGQEAPKLYWVSFLAGELPPDRAAWLQTRVGIGEYLHVHGREIYAWLPDGVARSKLAAGMAAPGRVVTATARNWRTVQALADMAAEQR